MAEALGAAAMRLLPCSEAERRLMLEESGVTRLLSRARGGPAPDPEAIMGALDGLARLLAAVLAVQEVEVNPLRCAADGCLALDARVLFAP
jgi:acetyltransferase